MKKIEWTSLLKPLFIIFSILYAIPSIIYYAINKTVLNFTEEFKFLLHNTNRTEQAIIYLIILIGLTILYFLIIKNREKIFKNVKRMYLFITVTAIMYVVVIPFMSSDVFYYLGIGRLNSKYHQNPYYTTIAEFVENEGNEELLQKDTVLQKGKQNVWSDTTVVYGPVWTFICSIFGAMSFGNVDVGLLLFKIMAVLLHILNCYLIYKITKKKIFVLIYGLNPFILLEGIASVHNDLYIITFVLGALYFLINKKKLLLSLVFLALATAIKYFTILLLPFIIIYYFRDKKPLERLKYCFIYGIIFFILVGITYILYVQDWTVLMGIFTQQEKFAKNFYIILMEYFGTIPDLPVTLNRTLLICFVIVYFFTCLILLNKKKITLKAEMSSCEKFLIAFLFLLITNFQPWYIMWLFPLLMWQKPEHLRLIVQVSIISQLANTIFLINGEGWRNGTPYTFFMLLGICICLVINNKRRQNCGQICFNRWK